MSGLLIKLKTPEARQRLVDAGGLKVKGRYCAVMDPIQQEVAIKLHWVPFHVPDASIRRVFTEFGEVKDVRQDAWGAAGFETVESTTSLVRMTLREDLTTEDLPHLFKFYGGSVLVVVRLSVCGASVEDTFEKSAEGSRSVRFLVTCWTNV
ncbi:hypothetical protein HPB48_019159 [Haemaphysalis longicornis]|uniref:Uncharacterized protein n=1 Tax=Haemaphysalis longicornis TaxID=44386 RepID=A0A9J6FYB8_HAELO|nr:hypothetical protein HPB48_019159 [Haemaphysalis longicornis]